MEGCSRDTQTLSPSRRHMAQGYCRYLFCWFQHPHGMEEDESEFNYIKGDERGPEHWGELDEEWRACGNGRQQSPIALVKSEAVISPDLGELRRNYYPANATLENRGHDIMVKWATGAGSIEIEGRRYRLNQCHWHTPAEHTVNGRRYPLEMHLVHESEDKKIVVVGILYTYGRPDTFLAELIDEIASIADKEPPEVVLGMVNPKHIKIGSRKYYRYNGSLTTPPCTEGVTWNIVHKVRTVSREQVRALHMAIHDKYEKNARPIQSTNERIVKLYTPKRNPQLH
ncbi:alpha carbonic anhydrase 7 isoform X2 [Cryptomeria japonica]|uniref:alpha carbonic anhydrase 7 isoform X2 n=1 Tax=Cryptomeria japonica TaxID=3369 RepID=UPI0027D9F15B|nr:alpha carbonic anhydrase 7 isoform X2 [Cryptomeria japonica]